MEEPHRKRLRTDATTSASTSQAGLVRSPTAADIVRAAKRDDDYWFEDGNIILVSENVSFKVYRGLLAEHSSVFRSMLDVGQGTQNPADIVDGCPVVPLYDSPNDLRGLFRIIFPLRKNLKFSNWKVDMDFISAIIRLDHKYELKGLYDQAMGYLTTYYTTNFDDWLEGRNATEWRPEPIHAIGAINLAHLTHTHTILPLAYYICATLGSNLPVGYARPDGTMERLSPDDLRICLDLKARLTAENVHSAFLLLRYPGQQHCSNSQAYTSCSELFRRLLEHVGLSKGPHAIASDRALDSWMDTIDSYTPPATQNVSPYMVMYQTQSRSLCKGCRAFVQNREREMRRQIWRKLPEYVGVTIDNWDAPIASG
ncbi:hypothetical protein L226DRAFT_146930 [Lentinus tigrinus ALCF2SS1-7]|uniref:BTB domain-containing protein n=1 Tax=Lentinus tigrinus ALCF2SS1-6 TaxID=1328759 RepID=A0A5C2S4J0_9APHY|nr:hypothetical protein L227DRAFT_180971 [Lentinus tigrinus ALCF2SS1-6]RPD72787.1 hypothetical protein L226DRAFT_146930 [Lentinus tigrinus ALCF2SS1-7]